MVKKALTLLTSILFALPLLMPFNIYADTITTNNIKGINTVLISKDQNYAITNSWYYLYEHTITLDADYIGIITLDINLNYYTENSGNSVATISNKQFFVNGNTIKINQVVTSDNYGNQGPIRSSSYLLKSSNVIKSSTVTELQQIIDLLTDIYNSNDQVEGLLSNQLQQLQLVVSNTSLANQYLDTISKLRQYNMPIESLYFVSYVYADNQNKVIDAFNTSYYSYPVFIFDSGNRIISLSTYTDRNSYFVFLSRYITLSNFSNSFTLNNADLINLEQISNIGYGYNGNNESYRLQCYKVSFKANSSSNVSLVSNIRQAFVPISFSIDGLSNYSTDFALLYGFNNPLLDNINKIANGTVQSNSASSSNDIANEQLQTESNTLFQQENGFKSDMQSAMQNVNNTFRLQDMGTKFVSSAQWVRTQYEQLTNNTPFASLITFSLITGLALILLGKVYK